MFVKQPDKGNSTVMKRSREDMTYTNDMLQDDDSA